jgi:hypothetical protein
MRSSHARMAFGGHGVAAHIDCGGLVARAPFGLRHLRTMRTIGGENAMELNQVNPQLPH